MKDLKKIRTLRYKKFKTLKLLRLNFTYIKRFSKKKHYKKLKHTVGLLKVLSGKFGLSNLICNPTVLFSKVVFNKYTGFYLNASRFAKPTSSFDMLSATGESICRFPKSATTKYLTNLKHINVVGTKDILLFNSIKQPQTPPALYRKKVVYNQSYIYTRDLIKGTMLNSSFVPNTIKHKNQTNVNISLVKLLFLF